MDKELRQFVAERCFQMERKLTDRLRHETEALGRMVARTVKTLATKEDLLDLQERIEVLERS